MKKITEKYANEPKKAKKKESKMFIRGEKSKNCKKEEKWLFFDLVYDNKNNLNCIKTLIKMIFLYKKEKCKNLNKVWGWGWG